PVRRVRACGRHSVVLGPRPGRGASDRSYRAGGGERLEDRGHESLQRERHHHRGNRISLQAWLPPSGCRGGDLATVLAHGAGGLPRESVREHLSRSGAKRKCDDPAMKVVVVTTSYPT